MNAFQTNEPPLIRIVDDEERMRESLAFMLRQEGFECAMYPSAEAFLREDSPSRPGCLLLDVQMDGMTGLELQEEMNRRGMTLPIVFLSAHGDLDMAVDTMRRGAAAFIQKTADRARLMEAIVSAVERSSAPSKNPGEEIARWQSLTDREREVGERLGGISVKTVQVHRGEVCRKLGVKGASGIAQAVRSVRRILREEK